MAKKENSAYNEGGIILNLQFEGELKENLTYQVVVFDRDGKPVFNSPVRETEITLPFSREELFSRRIFLTPYNEVRRTELTLEKIESIGSYEINLPKQTDPSNRYIISKIPEYIWQWWLFCDCHSS